MRRLQAYPPPSPILSLPAKKGLQFLPLFFVNQGERALPEQQMRLATRSGPPLATKNGPPPECSGGFCERSEAS